MTIRLLTVAMASVLALAACQPSQPAADAAAPATDATADAATPPATAPADAATTDTASFPTVGGAPMDPAKDIVDNASQSQDHTTLVAAVQAAGLVETLKGAGPFTVFAPTNAAFEKLPAGTVDTLLKPESKEQLTGVLTYHVVPGNVLAADLVSQIQAGGGQAVLKTVAGGELIAKAGGPGGVTITDASGNVSNVTIADVKQSNGVVHVVDTVLLPKQ